MNSFKRIRLAAMILGGVLIVQGALLAHMMLGSPNVYPPLRKPFSKLPQTLEVDGKPSYTWSYVPSSMEAEIKVPFKPVDMSHRIAHCPDLGLTARCYVVCAENGEDRKHHPEICIRDVKKIPESPDDRKTIYLGGDVKRPVQRYVFQGVYGDKTAVYYWYYVFKPLVQPDQTRLQSLYQSFNRMPPSVTVQVIANATESKWADIESKLIAPLDKKLRDDCLPAGVQMGTERLPIGLQTK